MQKISKICRRYPKSISILIKWYAKKYRSDTCESPNKPSSCNAWLAVFSFVWSQGHEISWNLNHWFCPAMPSYAYPVHGNSRLYIYRRHTNFSSLLRKFREPTSKYCPAESCGVSGCPAQIFAPLPAHCTVWFLGLHMVCPRVFPFHVPLCQAVLSTQGITRRHATWASQSTTRYAQNIPELPQKN